MVPNMVSVGGTKLYAGTVTKLRPFRLLFRDFEALLSPQRLAPLVMVDPKDLICSFVSEGTFFDRYTLYNPVGLRPFRLQDGHDRCNRKTREFEFAPPLTARHVTVSI